MNNEMVTYTVMKNYVKSRVKIRLKILFSNFLLIHYEAEVGI